MTNQPEETDLDILQDLYDSEINASIWWNWDGGVEVRIGDGIYWQAGNTERSIADAVDWLKLKTFELYPNSTFTKKYRPTPTPSTEESK